MSGRTDLELTKRLFLGVCWETAFCLYKNNLKKRKKDLHFYDEYAIIPKSSARRTFPGVAKFGIALEWGSRGLEFESRHSDQKAEATLVVSAFSFSM